MLDTQVQTTRGLPRPWLVFIIGTAIRLGTTAALLWIYTASGKGPRSHVPCLETSPSFGYPEDAFALKGQMRTSELSDTLALAARRGLRGPSSGTHARRCGQVGDRGREA